YFPHIRWRLTGADIPPCRRAQKPAAAGDCNGVSATLLPAVPDRSPAGVKNSTLAAPTPPAGAMITTVHHTAVSVPDLDRALAFYCGVLGFELELCDQWRRAPAIDTVIGLPGSAGRIAMVRLGAARLELFEYQ